MAVAVASEWASSQTENITTNWCVPTTQISQTNSLLVRTDAAWNGAGKVAGLGWIIVDQIRATSFSSFTRFLSSPLVAEGLGLVTEILTCRDFGHPRIRCESDSSQLIKAINSDCSFAKLYGIVADIDAIASSFEFISFGWISLERNSVADRLAKQGCLLSLP